MLEVTHNCDDCGTRRSPDKCYCEKCFDDIIAAERKEAFNEGYEKHDEELSP